MSLINKNEISSWVARFSPLIPREGRVLDLACGSGRHSRFLADSGYRVEALDRDANALAGLKDIPGLCVRQADIENGPWPYAGEKFSAIIVTNYLWRPIMPLLMQALDKGGLLIYETYMVGNERFGKPSNPAFLLRKDELRFMVREHLDIIAFEQGEITQPRQAMMQRICATRLGELKLPE